MTAARLDRGARLRAVFFGSPAFAVPCLRAVAAETELCAVVSQPDRPAGRGQAPAAPPVKARGRGARRARAAAREGAHARDAGRAGGALAADLFVVVAYGRILPQAAARSAAARRPTTCTPRCCRSCAARRRSSGRSSTATTETGVSIMRMEAGLDTGPVAAMRAHRPSPTTTPPARCRRSWPSSARSCWSRRCPPSPSARVALRAAGRRARRRWRRCLTKADGMLKFDRPARLVSAQARGVDPWPGATTMLAGRAAQAVRAAGPGRRRPAAAAGRRSATVTSDGLVIACDAADRHLVAFGELQFPGKRRMPAALARERLRPGTRLGA